MGYSYLCQPLDWSYPTDSLHTRVTVHFILATSDSTTHTHYKRFGYQHTHTHPFNGPFSGTTQVSRYQKGKTNLDFTEARDSGSGIS